MNKTILESIRLKIEHYCKAQTEHCRALMEESNKGRKIPAEKAVKFMNLLAEIGFETERRNKIMSVASDLLGDPMLADPTSLRVTVGAVVVITNCITNHNIPLGTPCISGSNNTVAKAIPIHVLLKDVSTSKAYTERDMPRLADDDEIHMLCDSLTTSQISLMLRSPEFSGMMDDIMNGALIGPAGGQSFSHLEDED